MSLAELTETKGTWHSATGMELALMARALGPSEKRNIVLAGAYPPFPGILRVRRPSFHRSRGQPYSLNDLLALVTLCLVIIARLYLFYATYTLANPCSALFHVVTPCLDSEPLSSLAVTAIFVNIELRSFFFFFFLDTRVKGE